MTGNGNEGQQQFILVGRPTDGVLLIRLNRPAKRNALSAALVGELGAALRQAGGDDAVRCVVLTGDDRAFSAGADIADQAGRGLDAVFHPGRLAGWDEVQNFPKPLIAAVNGYALGGGNELVMLCDIAIAGDTALFGQPEIKIGIFPGDGGTQRLPRLVGKSNAMKMILTGEPIDARTAREIGLVSEVVPAGETVERALAIARLIANRSPIALQLAKKSVLAAYEMPLEAGLRQERENIRLAFESEDQKEGMAAFLDKRKPAFRGQ